MGDGYRLTKSSVFLWNKNVLCQQPSIIWRKSFKMWGCPWVAKTWRIEHIMMSNSPSMIFCKPMVLNCSCFVWGLRILVPNPLYKLLLCHLSRHVQFAAHTSHASKSSYEFSYEWFLGGDLIKSFYLTAAFLISRWQHRIIMSKVCTPWQSMACASGFLNSSCDSKEMLKSGNTTKYHE